MAKLARLERERQLLPRDRVIEMSCAIVKVARDRFLGLGPKLAARLAQASRPAECQAIVYDATCEVLTDLSQLEVVAERAANGRGRKAARRAGG
jgi:hypothetical protein